MYGFSKSFVQKYAFLIMSSYQQLIFVTPTKTSFKCWKI